MNDSFFEYNKRKIDNKNKRKNKIIKKKFIFMEKINILINNNNIINYCYNNSSPYLVNGCSPSLLLPGPQER